MGTLNIFSMNADLEGWHNDTDFGCELKTTLRTNVRMKTGKEYRGVLRRDSEAIIDEFLCRDAHYSFVETLAPAACRRNPRLFDGQHITLTRRDDGYLRLNFKPLKMEPGFTVDGFALAVCNEIRQALKGLVEESGV